ncbi:hypothetical protein FBUS_11387, partial [Fasciolopsis buskii]
FKQLSRNGYVDPSPCFFPSGRIFSGVLQPFIEPMIQLASDLGSDPADWVLVPADFEQKVAECQHFITYLKTQSEFHSAEDPVPSLQWKELAMFEITYTELKVWLDRTRTLMQNRRNTSLSRCESYLIEVGLDLLYSLFSYGCILM